MGETVDWERGEKYVDPRSSKWSRSLFRNLEKQEEFLWSASDFVDCTLAVLVTKLNAHERAAYWFLWSRGLLSVFSV